MAFLYRWTLGEPRSGAGSNSAVKQVGDPGAQCQSGRRKKEVAEEADVSNSAINRRELDSTVRPRPKPDAGLPFR